MASFAYKESFEQEAMADDGVFVGDMSNGDASQFANGGGNQEQERLVLAGIWFVNFEVQNLWFLSLFWRFFVWLLFQIEIEINFIQIIEWEADHACCP